MRIIYRLTDQAHRDAVLAGHEGPQERIATGDLPSDELAAVADRLADHRALMA